MVSTTNDVFKMSAVAQSYLQKTSTQVSNSPESLLVEHNGKIETRFSPLPVITHE